MENLDLETIAMTLVGNAGEGRSLAYEALAEAKKGNFEKADELLKESQKRTLAAHEIQTQLICNEADGNKTEMSLLMVHAQDHLMTTMTLREVALEMLELYKKVN